MDHNILSLEAFEAHLHGHIVQWYLPKNILHSAYPPGFDEIVLHVPVPYVRKILISSAKSSESWKLTDKWDLFFQPSSPQDWGLLLSILQNQPKHTLVIFSPEVQIPYAFVQKTNRTLTYIHFSYLAYQPLPPSIQYDATFFPFIASLEDPSIEIIQSLLPRLLPPDLLKLFVLKDALKDMKGSGASFVISKIDEPHHRPALCWYYATKQQKTTPHILQILETLLLRE